MRKRTLLNILIDIFLITLICVYPVILKKYLVYEEVIVASYLIVTSFFAISFLGYRKDKNNAQKKSIRNTIIFEALLYFVITYASGFLFGFLKNSYSLTPVNITVNLICPLIIMIASEVIRNTVIKANKDKFSQIIIVTILLIIIEALMSIMCYNLKTLEGLFKFGALSLLPLITKHCFLSYLSYHSGIKNQVLFRVIFETKNYFMPILPNLEEFAECVVQTLYPCIVYFTIFSIVNKREYVEKDFKVKKYGIADVVLVLIFLGLFCVTSGVFDLELRAIASDSMKPTFARGDDVLIKFVHSDKELKKYDIIAFNYNNRLTVHRIVEIKKKGKKTYYYTKGDANNGKDNVELTIKDVKGKVIFRLPCLGYPNVWIDEFRRNSQ